MNTLSWLLYAAEVVSNIGALLVATGAFGLLGLVIVSIIYAVEKGGLVPNFGRYVAALVVSLLVGASIPSRNTIYMIAASEMGEKVAPTDDAKEVYNLLRNKVREVLAPAPAK